MINVPIEFQVWTAADCGEYLGTTAAYFLRVTRWQKGFPPILPMSEGKRPRWRAQYVMEYAVRDKYTS